MAELDHLTAKVRDLTRKFKAGDSSSFYAFKDLISLLLHSTIAKQTSGVRLFQGTEQHLRVLGGLKNPKDPIALNNGHFLRLTISPYIDHAHHNALKIRQASYQYQLDRNNDDRWAFRYDYLRYPDNNYPASHLQINAKLIVAKHIRRDAPKIHLSLKFGDRS